MENPEEVLHALDEFQKVRPSEIPRELEDYLCWVARTGDPVYQWSLVKALFREKLVKVMSEFQENCPTLDLAPCPNVEQFNYDIMKRTLIERLESFSNAPFTVQRICELLTTPRKEYNRIDKFMRAIEKNILVVSTREPGPLGRRSENGDSLVNGSLEDESLHHGQTSNEVDMDNWVKDCTTSVPLQTPDSNDLSVENGMNSTNKQLEKMEQQVSSINPLASGSASLDFQTNAVINTQTPLNAVIAPTLSGNNQESIDVSDAIMNEDTSSQPSLELESEDSNSNDSKKLQTAFEAKDFDSLLEENHVKTYAEALQSGKSDKNEEQSEVCNLPIELNYSNETAINNNTHDNAQNNTEVSQTPENNDEAEQNLTSTLDTSNKDQTTSEENSANSSDISKQDDIIASTDTSSDVDNSAKPIIETEESSSVVCKESLTESVKEQVTTEPVLSENSSAEPSNEKETSEPAVEEDKVKLLIEDLIPDSNKPSPSIEAVNSELKVEEALIENSETTSSIESDATPVIEEPKEVADTISKDLTEAISKPADVDSAVNNGLSESPVTNLLESNEMIVTDEPVSTKNPSESMDVDDGATLATATGDEPMDQEQGIESMSS
ncbi:serine/threonine-protein phosphatase 4 regulatory subunit 2 [Trichogramma pretiosum]|uniref:serine/threonine-protein phosphatase 4 regulatory subunit 2 n=1 Tax=Trichogramma pretiosum TaxID=7493 RepID=UPI0006C98B56|nr:serine/threonine-protein phosphatase 4 regulatory subunit 2 [Trichogramma pretiosum]